MAIVSISSCAGLTRASIENGFIRSDGLPGQGRQRRTLEFTTTTRALVERFEHREQLVRRGGEVADARAGRVMDRVDDRRARAADAELAKPLAAERAAVRVGLIDKYRVDRADIGVHHDMVARQVLVDERAEALVDVVLLHQRAADAPDHPADHLRARGFWIENTAGRKHAEHAPNA